MKLEIKTIATGSSGNCYHLKYGENELLIECGIPIKKIKEALKFKLSRVSGCLASHCHGDHFKSANDMMRAGIDVYASSETFTAGQRKGHRSKILLHGVMSYVGNWKVMPFDTEHDCPGCVGFLIAIGGEKILFATDTAFIRNRFEGLTRVIVECNYDENTITTNIHNGSLEHFRADRVMATHFGLENVLEFLRANDLSNVESIHLIHLSDANANEQVIREAVEQATGKMVIIP